MLVVYADLIINWKRFRREIITKAFMLV
jgi:hypothetical protein